MLWSDINIFVLIHFFFFLDLFQSRISVLNKFVGMISGKVVALDKNSRHRCLCFYKPVTTSPFKNHLNKLHLTLSVPQDIPYVI